MTLGASKILPDIVTHCLLKTKLEQALENLESLDEDRKISI